VYVARVKLRNFRNYSNAETVLGSGLTVVHGPVGAGKTNLLEALYFACVGRSCRGAAERELLRFGEQVAVVSATTANGDAGHDFEVAIQAGHPKVVRIDGVRSERLVDITDRPLLCVFMPDRLELVKGAAAGRRAHLDALVAALWPTRRATRAAYGRALAQRNALLARVRRASAAPGSLSGWNRELARQGAALIRDRSEAIVSIADGFSSRAAALGLEGEARLRYRPRVEASGPEDLERELESSLAQDLERGFTTRGPHRDELVFELGGRELRRFGSQGQQRLGLLALILSERDALARARGQTPILLLDDVLSELDRERRELLLDAARREGQTLVTTADRSAVPEADGSVDVHVSGGAIGG
jgi:DNA replication and repair protein RecF